jgi:adenylate kinase family enzyme
VACDLISFIGLPGSGKSTLSAMLAEKFKFQYYETSKLLDEAIERAENNSYKIFGARDFEAEKQLALRERGLNCENDFVCKVVFGKLLGYTNGTIICGFPRDCEQAVKLVEFVKNIRLNSRFLVVLPKISEKLSLQRMLKKNSTKYGEDFIAEETEIRFRAIKYDFDRVLSVLGKNRIKIVQTDGSLPVDQSFEKLLEEIKKPH